MSLGTSDGQQFDSYMDMFASQNEQNSRPVTVTQQNPGNSFGIDRSHHVPLVASAILDDAGQPTGDIAIDHRIPPKPEYEPYLHLHEMSEMYHMNNLMKSGMNPQDAYHEAHDKIATPLESAAVKADMGEDGLEAYKKYWREAASIAAEPTDKPRHPQAHTTVHGLDEGEGIKGLTHLAMAGEGDEPNLFTGQPAEPPDATPEVHMKDKALKAAETVMGGSIALKPIGEAGSPKLQYQVLDNNKPVAFVNFRDMGKGHYYLSETGMHREGLWGRPNRLGPSTVRQVFREFLKANPDATRITASRVSGARSKFGTVGHVDFDVKDGKLVLRKPSEKPFNPSPEAIERLANALRRRPQPQEELEPDIDEQVNMLLEHAGEGKSEPETPSWRNLPLRARLGQFLGRDAPLSERGPAAFRNAMRDQDIRPRDYEGSSTTMPLARYGPAAFLRALQRQEPED